MRQAFLVVSLLAIVWIAASCTTTKTTEVAESPDTGASAAPPVADEGAEGQPAEGGEAEAAGPQVIKATTGDETDADELQVTHETSEFAPTTPAVYCRVELKGVPVGAKVKGTLVGVSVTDSEGKTGEDVEIASKEVEAPQADFAVTLSFTVNDKEWPVGDYKVVIDVDGQTIEEVPLTCAK
jgi:hypothetical protein